MSLTFLTPLMLAGVALVAAPIILHLVMRRQPKHLVFPAMQFIKLREQANRRQLRLRHLLLLALRCAAILLLALALARPSLQSAGLLGDQESPVAAALVFDTSPRMQYRFQNQTRLEAAQKAAERVLAQLPAESEVAVVDSRSAGAAFAIDATVARQRIERLNQSPTGRPLAETCQDALRLVEKSEKSRKELYVFTDLAQSAWTIESADGLREKLAADPTIALYVIDVGAPQPQNFALGDLRLSAETLAKNAPVRLETEVTHLGPEEQRSVALYVNDSNGQPQLRAQSESKPQPEQTETVDFQIGGLDQGIHQGFVRIVGEDGLAADDVRYFTVEVRPAWKVLVVAPKPIERRALFLTEALAPASFRRGGQARFECDVISVEDLATKQLRDYAAVCLLDPPPMSDATWNALTDFVDSGGGLGIWLGRNAQPAGRSAEEFNSAASQKLMPGKLARQWRRQDAFLAPQNYQHPLLAKFRSVSGNVPWDAFTIWSHWQLDGLAAGANVVVPYSNGQAAIVERNVGKGRVLLFTTPISEDSTETDLWNLLAVGSEPWPFVMLANESLFYLVGSGEERLNGQAGQAVSLRVPDNQRQLVFSMRTPEGEDFPQSVDQKTGQMLITASETPGNYLLRAGATDGGVRLGFSANLSSSSTDLHRLTTDELTTLLGKDRFRLARSNEDIERDVSIGRTGRELYPVLIFLVALALGLEHLLANRFYRRDPGSKKSIQSTSLGTEGSSVQPQPVSAT